MNLKKTIFILPNLLTAASLFCGMYAVFRCMGPVVSDEDVYNSSLLLFYAFIFDLFDGRVARMTKTQSAFGVEFDSLADLISFGVAPAVIAYRWALQDTGIVGVIVCFLYVLGGAIRLGRFNIITHNEKKSSQKEKKPGKYMLGLPIPMAAAFIVALVVASNAMGGWPWPWGHEISMIIMMVGLAFLMVSAVKFRSFKDLKVNWFSAVLLAIVISVSGILWIKFSPGYILIGLLMLYVGMGFGEAIIFWPKRRREKQAEKNKSPL